MWSGGLHLEVVRPGEETGILYSASLGDEAAIPLAEAIAWNEAEAVQPGMRCIACHARVTGVLTHVLSYSIDGVGNPALGASRGDLRSMLRKSGRTPCLISPQIAGRSPAAGTGGGPREHPLWRRGRARMRLFSA